jgi:hypothetical protein
MKNFKTDCLLYASLPPISREKSTFFNGISIQFHCILDKGPFLPSFIFSPALTGTGLRGYNDIENLGFPAMKEVLP